MWDLTRYVRRVRVRVRVWVRVRVRFRVRVWVRVRVRVRVWVRYVSTPVPCRNLNAFVYLIYYFKKIKFKPKPEL